MSDPQELGTPLGISLPPYDVPTYITSQPSGGELATTVEIVLPSATMLTKVEIGGDRCDAKLLSYTLERVAGRAIHAVDLMFSQTVDTLANVAAGKTLNIWRRWNPMKDWDKIFSGQVEHFELEGARTRVQGRDKMAQLIRREVNHVYDNTVDASAGKISEIFKDIVVTYGGLTADATSVQDSGTTTILQKFVCNRANVFAQLQKLADILDWQFYYRADTDKIYFEPRGYTNNSSTLTLGANLIQVPAWAHDTNQLVNDVYVAGGEQLVETTEFFNGTGSATVFTIAASPVSTKVYISSVLKEGGISGSSATADYYVDKEKKTITFVSAPAVGTNNVEVRYSKMSPVIVHTQDQASIDSYGRHTRTFTNSGLRNAADASAWANVLLSRYKDPFVSANLRLRNTQVAGLIVGQKVRVTDSINGKNDLYTINRHVIRYPSVYDEMQVGALQWNELEYLASLAGRVKSLEEESLRGATIVTDTASAGANFSNARYRRVVQTRTIGNTFILDHPDNSILDGSKILGDDYTTWVTSEDVTF